MPYFEAFGGFSYTRYIFPESLDVSDSIRVYDTTCFCEIK